MSNQLPSLFQNYIHLSRYARWLDDENRRETWTETVTRYFDFFEGHLKKHHDYTLTPELRKELEDAVTSLEVMPSMRALMTAGKALERDNVAGYNCAFQVTDESRVFDEIVYILMCGTGDGFSVERQFTNTLNPVAEEFYPTDTTIIVEDSKIGWAKAYRELISLLYNGQIPNYDVSKLRPAGAKLKVFGGRSSGPAPLVELFKFTIELFKNAKGRKLNSLECHDLICKIASVVVVGGVRRSALISLSNLSDDRMRLAKSGDFGSQNPQRYLANNSAVYDEKPDMQQFMNEWKSLYESKSGERGIFARYAVKKQIERLNEFRKSIPGVRMREYQDSMGTNPCSEIILRSKQFCNLSEVVVRETDTKESLLRKIRLATILGTFQSTLTNFRYLSSKWKKNTEEERLLGVSLTGILDNTLLNKWDDPDLPELLYDLRKAAIVMNHVMAAEIGIPASTAITAVKPSGTVSSLVNSASGIHPRHAPYYIRRVRGDKKDPVTMLMEAAGIPCEDDVVNPSTKVFSFPMKAPSGAVNRDELNAIDHLELWKVYQLYYCEHKPSVTITVREHEWMAVGAWVYENFDFMTGVSFLPHSDHVYQQAPYETVDEEAYNELLGRMPKSVDWSKLHVYEKTDTTTGTQELACVAAGGCEIV